MDLTAPYPSPAIIGRNCETTSPNIRKPEKDRTFLIFIVVCCTYISRYSVYDVGGYRTEVQLDLKKIQVLAIFDDLDTILLMIPLQIMMIGLRWQLIIWW